MEWDAAIGQYYDHARLYGPVVGRFAQRDPIGFTSHDVNLYRYVLNEPSCLVDYSGHSPSGGTSEQGLQQNQQGQPPGQSAAELQADINQLQSNLSIAQNRCAILSEKLFDVEAGKWINSTHAAFVGGIILSAGPEAWWLEGFVGAEWKIADCILDFRKQQLNEQLMAATANAMVIKRDLQKAQAALQKLKIEQLQQQQSKQSGGGN